MASTTMLKIIGKFLNLLGGFVFWLTAPVFRWLFDGCHRMIPPATDPLTMKSATDLARMIRSREVTSEEVLTAFVSRIHEINPYVNAVVANRFEAALNEAKEIDKILDSDNIPEKFSESKAPFLGVPLTTKEAISIKGLPNTSGLLARKNVTSDADADVIAAMRSAGAIPIALTNVSEVCMWYESSNLLYGRTNNAYHQGRMVGGSSGGEGCLHSAAASAMGIGSDIGGSIRMPAFFNGIFGHKPTTGVISNSGQFPLARGNAITYLGTGPMCRFACDLLPIMKILVLSDKRDQLNLDHVADVKKLKYFYMEDDGGGLLMSPVHPQIKNAVNKAAKHFEDLGCDVKKVKLPQLKHSFQIWSTMMTSAGTDSLCHLMGNCDEPVNPLVELFYWLTGRPRHTLPAIYIGFVEKDTNSPEIADWMRKTRDSLLKDLEDMLGDDGVFLYPTHPLPALYHNQPLLLLSNFAYTGVFNVLGLPVTAVPMGLCNEGVPIGIQVVGSRHRDRLTIAVAAELEKAFGGWVPPF